VEQLLVWSAPAAGKCDVAGPRVGCSLGALDEQEFDLVGGPKNEGDGGFPVIGIACDHGRRPGVEQPAQGLNARIRNHDERSDDLVVRTTAGIDPANQRVCKIVTKRLTDGKSKRERIFERDEFRCVYCAVNFPADELTIDHVEPRRKGGDGSAGNLVTCCRTCNEEKAGAAAWVFLARRPELRENFLLHASAVWPRLRRAVQEEAVRSTNRIGVPKL
jgi:hypothetical protein